MQFPLIPSLWIALLLGILPGLSLILFLVRSKAAMVATLLGAAGWTVALFLRLPLLQVINSLPPTSLNLVIISFSASALAGIFEEGLRFLIIRIRNSNTFFH